MLAQSAARAGLRPISLDWFADMDTAESSSRYCAVCEGDRFDVEKILSAADRYAPGDGRTALIYGGGFDGRSELLAKLTRGRTLWGNPPELLRRVKAPADFFPLLDQLGIPYPETRESPPNESHSRDVWLIKQGSSQGGIGVRFFMRSAAPCDPAPADRYFQRFIDAPPRSVLFLANGVDIELIGFNTLQTSCHREGHPFLFAGAATDSCLAPGPRAAVRHYALALTRALSLNGLNSLDFVIDGDTCRVLELNPRPSATMALYDIDYAAGLVASHIEACQGRLISRRIQSDILRCFKILYSDRAVTIIPKGFDWPQWAADRPWPGSSIGRGQPVCSIGAEGSDLFDLNQQLFAREQVIRSALML